MEKNKGFTLTELLAVIVILAIIALISTPIIIGVIEKARKGAFEDSAYGVLDAGRIYFVDKLADQNKFEGAIFIFPDGGDLKVSGEKPAGGTLALDTNGKQAIALYDKDKKWCALKEYDEEKITIKEYKEEECKTPTLLMGVAKTIIDKNTSGNTEGLFTDDFGNTRYRGNNSVVKNYVKFNNEVWRIIGVFDGSVKLIRNDRIENSNDLSHPDTFLWNTADINNWVTSDLKDYLNNGYYHGLQNTAQQMIDDKRYNLGGVQNVRADKKTLYEQERGTRVYNERPTEWIGKISLMYLSDYGYAAGDDCPSTHFLSQYNNSLCRYNNWLIYGKFYEWLLTPNSNTPNYTFYNGTNGDVSHWQVSTYFMAVRPVLYLKPNVQIISGDGTSSNPYQLSV